MTPPPHRSAGWFVAALLGACGESPQDPPGALARDSGIAPGRTAFTDVTAESGIDFVYTFGDDAFSCILEDTGSGVALIDHDGDGLLDVYFLNGGWVEGVSDPAFAHLRGRTNALYRNLGGWRFEDVTARAGVGDTGYGMGAAVGDYDGDGDEDLYVLNHGPNVLYRNQGDGTFRDVTHAAGVAGPEELGGHTKWSVSGFFFDQDEDGDLDLYVANYLAFDPEFRPSDLPPQYPYPGPESYAGQVSLLYRNDGDGTFSDATEAAGLGGFPGKTMGAVPCDLDGDGDLDVFEAVDDMQNYLFRHDEGHVFHEVAVASGVAFDGKGKAMASMHGSAGDVDGDGTFDLFVPDLEQGCLYRNKGGLAFEEAGAAAGIARALSGSGGWGSCLEDFDNDADLDLLVVLGGAFDLAAGERDRLFLNDGSGRFRDVSDTLGGYFESADVSRGAAFGDLDNDGDVDFVVSRKDVAGTPRLVRNDLAKGHWVTLKLVGKGGNRDAIGARVELVAGGRSQTRWVHRNGSYLSQNDVRLHFGLGDATQGTLSVTWPSGAVEELALEQVDRVVTVVQDAR